MHKKGRAFQKFCSGGGSNSYEQAFFCPLIYEKNTSFCLFLPPPPEYGGKQYSGCLHSSQSPFVFVSPFLSLCLSIFFSISISLSVYLSILLYFFLSISIYLLITVSPKPNFLTFFLFLNHIICFLVLQDIQMNNQKKKIEIFISTMSEIIFKISGPHSKSRKMKVIGGKKVFSKSCRKSKIIFQFFSYFAEISKISELEPKNMDFQDISRN